MAESTSMYQKLQHVILPMYYNRPSAYAKVMRSSIALNGSFFNAQRMVSQYVENAYNAQALAIKPPSMKSTGKRKLS